MTLEEQQEIITHLATSHEFYNCLMLHISNVQEGPGTELFSVALWFFSQGYLTALEKLDKKNEFFKHEYEKPTCN